MRRVGLSLLVVATLAAAASTSRVVARFTDAPGVAANAFATGACFTKVQSFQKGSTTNAVNGTTTVTIASVDTTKAFLIFSTRHSSNRPVGSLLRGRIAGATTLEFVRVTNEGAPVTITIQWYVVEYTCGVKVQRGSATQSGMTVNVAITPVASLSQAFVTFSKTANATEGIWSEDDPVVADLTTTSNLQIRSHGTTGHTIWWQVIEFLNPAEINVQKGSAALTGTATSTTATLGTAVNTARTFVLVSLRTPSATTANIGARLVRARLTNPTTITIDRSISGAPDDVTEINWQAVELKDGTAVQSGSEAFASGTGTRNVTITSVDTTKTVAFGAYQSGGGENCGRSPYAADDVIGVACVTANVASATQLTLVRSNTAAPADIGWFVVQFTTRP